MPVADSAADQMRALQQTVKQRRLYLRTSEESVVWFPHDNHPDLLKELVWESGSPRWVFAWHPSLRRRHHELPGGRCVCHRLM